MNKFFNFNIPNFNKKYGSDWSAFRTVIDDNTDYLMLKTWELYFLCNINTMSNQAVERELKKRGVEYLATDTLKIKKLKLRLFVTTYKSKGMEDFYLDLAEEIVGIRGVIYSGYDVGVWRWGYSRWRATAGGNNAQFIRWASGGAQFEIYIDVKTTDSGELDSIQNLYEQDGVRPAFYQIYLVDSSFTILRTIT